jgi:outer membrane scaffolding protein for murein synthesis (MipA/OmpV family)
VFGLDGDFGPEYPGAQRYRVRPGPDIDIRYRDIAFLSVGEGLGVNLLRSDVWRGGIAATYDLGRSSDMNSRLKGLPNVPWAPEGKLFLERVIFPVVLRIDARHAFGGYEGWIGDLGAYMPVAGSEKYFIFVGPTATFANSTYMRHYFGVSDTAARNSHFRRYWPGDGFQSVGLGFSAVWNLTDHWFIGVDGAVQQLVGQAAASPIVENQTGYNLSMTVAYRF